MITDTDRLIITEDLFVFLADALVCIVLQMRHGNRCTRRMDV